MSEDNLENRVEETLKELREMQNVGNVREIAMRLIRTVDELPDMNVENLIQIAYDLDNGVTDMISRSSESWMEQNQLYKSLAGFKVLNRTQEEFKDEVEKVESKIETRKNKINRAVDEVKLPWREAIELKRTQTGFKIKPVFLRGGFIKDGNSMYEIEYDLDLKNVQGEQDIPTKEPSKTVVPDLPMLYSTFEKLYLHREQKKVREVRDVLHNRLKGNILVTSTRLETDTLDLYCCYHGKKSDRLRLGSEPIDGQDILSLIGGLMPERVLYEYIRGCTSFDSIEKDMVQEIVETSIVDQDMLDTSRLVARIFNWVVRNTHSHGQYAQDMFPTAEKSKNRIGRDFPPMPEFEVQSSYLTLGIYSVSSNDLKIKTASFEDDSSNQDYQAIRATIKPIRSKE